ncbi:hypothetical protein F5Y16DRAFT_335379 [Xylariaceae sp. FL0255]|nr:hypothetical protein F5Y16DRAFT_335379 [Xylariaceae sp. FL0255]
MDQQPPEQIQNELESFRQQWREEVSARSKNPRAPSPQSQRAGDQPGNSATSHQKHGRRHEPPSSRGLSTSTKKPSLDYDEDYVSAPAYGFQNLDTSTKSKAGEPSTNAEPKTALDFYEHAVEREATGKLGDSLQLYRTAFRMDDNVDKKYRNKHFADRWAKPATKSQQVNPSNAPVTVPNTAHHSTQGSVGGVVEDPMAEPVSVPLSLPELIASFANLKVEPASPECEGMEAAPCPIASLPNEILLHILHDVAITDIGDFVRLACVCKRLAYLVATEEQIWQRVCLGTEFGFGGMHHHWQRSITWDELGLEEMLADTETSDQENETDVYSTEQLQARRELSSRATTLSLYKRGARPMPTPGILPGVYGSWKSMFRQRPRVRFNGCYISTVNYIRPGQNTGNLLIWNAPVHIVTYYRYLRLYRDGTVISLTTTEEPAHVVHHLTRENIVLHRPTTPHHRGQPPNQHLPSAFMSAAYKGRWRLAPPTGREAVESGSSRGPPGTIATFPSSGGADAEGDLSIETEGVGKYTYRLDLSLRSAGKAAGRNNKLIWRGYWHYDRFTDDWAQFQLTHDKPFFFSRVKSYGLGE